MRSREANERLYEHDLCQVGRIALISVDGDYVEPKGLKKSKSKSKRKHMSRAARPRIGYTDSDYADTPMFKSQIETICLIRKMQV